MKALKWTGWIGLILLVAGLMWTTGCGGSDDDSGGTTTAVVTNSTGGTTTVVVTNTPAAPAAPEGMVAPQLVSPANNQSYNLYGGDRYTVDFMWTAVSEAKSYILGFAGLEYSVSGTTHSLHLLPGVYQWKVWGTDAEINTSGNPGPVSATFTVTVVDAAGPPAP
jgi:hypothetical protein